MQYLEGQKSMKKLKNLINSTLKPQSEEDKSRNLGHLLSLQRFRDLNKTLPNVYEWLLKNAQKLDYYDVDTVEHALDWLVQYPDQSKVVIFSVEKVVNSSKKWSLKLQNVNAVEQDKDVEVIYTTTDGYRVVKLVTPEAYKYEGKLMGHCVASYADKNTTIFSLRSPNNEPHATMEVKNKLIVQLQGKANSSVKPKYINSLLEALKHLNLDIDENYLPKIGFSCINKKEHKELVKLIDPLPVVRIGNKMYINHNDPYWSEL